MTSANRFVGAAALAAALLVPALAGGEVAVPRLSARVTDLTGTLDAGQRAALESKLAAFEAKKGSQIAVLLVPGTQPETIEQYSIRVVDQWKLGRKGIDDGALLLVAKNDRKLRIEVGRGLEGVIPDAIANRIIAEHITPRFKESDFYGGIDAGVDRMIRVIEGEPLPAPKAKPFFESVGHALGGGLDGVEALLGLLFLLMVVSSFLGRVLGRVGGAAATGGLVSFLLWLVFSALIAATIAGIVVFLIALFLGSQTGRHWSSSGGWGSSGAGWPSGGGGGGFSGGGGGFSGGGSSGSW